LTPRLVAKVTQLEIPIVRSRAAAVDVRRLDFRQPVVKFLRLTSGEFGEHTRRHQRNLTIRCLHCLLGAGESFPAWADQRAALL
jgi:hypothetical protein